MAIEDLQRWKSFGGDVGKHCRNCEERHVGCHGTCERYLEAKNAHFERKTQIIGEKSKDRVYDRFQAEQTNKRRKINRGKR